MAALYILSHVMLMNSTRNAEAGVEGAGRGVHVNELLGVQVEVPSFGKGEVVKPERGACNKAGDGATL